MTKHPLRIFNLVGGQLQEEPIDLQLTQCHPHDFKGFHDSYKDVHLDGHQERIAHAILSTGTLADIVTVGVGDPSSMREGQICEQKTFIVPAEQRHLRV